jgi:outer membrane protein OmpA-like peptidoglycan-associated protein
MKTTMLMASGLALSLLGTGCVATHKYVAKSIAPVEQRVSGTEGKNVEQDKQLAAHGTQIEGIDRDLSRTKERVTDADAKAVAAGDAAKQADSKAQGAQTAADGARGLAQQGVERSTQVGRNLDDYKGNVDKNIYKYTMVKSETVTFGLNRKTLDKDAKAKLDDFGKSLESMDRYVVEVQGFTDKTGDPIYNDSLSQERAASVARYLANEHKVPLHSITMLGTGISEGEQKTRADRAQSRKVDVRIFVPNSVSGANPATASN